MSKAIDYRRRCIEGVIDGAAIVTRTLLGLGAFAESKASRTIAYAIEPDGYKQFLHEISQLKDRRKRVRMLVLHAAYLNAAKAHLEQGDPFAAAFYLSMAGRGADGSYFAYIGEGNQTGRDKGLVTLFGTKDDRSAERRILADEWVALVKAGIRKTEAYQSVAKKHGVSEKTVQRASKEFGLR